MAPIRVLQVVTHMTAGGIETYLMNIYRNIDRTKIQFDFLTHREKQAHYDKEIKELGGKIYKVPRINPLKHRYYLNSLDAFFKEHKEYRIVHSHLNANSLYPLRVAKDNNIPVRIAHSHTADVPLDIKTPFRLYTKRQINTVTTHNFAASNKAGKWLYGGHDFKVINNAIDLKKFKFNERTRRKKRDDLNITDEFVIGHVGRFIKGKNHTFILDVFNELLKKEPSSKLILIGEGELSDNISNKINKLGLQEKVIMTGVRSDVDGMMQAFDVFLLPSFYEGLGIVAIESQAAGLITIVSENIPEEAFITDYIQSLALSKSPEKWADFILENKDYVRRNTSEEISKAGYNIEIETKKLENFYLEQY